MTAPEVVVDQKLQGVVADLTFGVERAYRHMGLVITSWFERNRDVVVVCTEFEDDPLGPLGHDLDLFTITDRGTVRDLRIWLGAFVDGIESRAKLIRKAKLRTVVTHIDCTAQELEPAIVYSRKLTAAEILWGAAQL